MTARPLELREVDKALAGRPVLQAVSFGCEPGRVTALLGPNGAGKTTTVALVTGLRRPDAGRVTVFGRPPTDEAARRRFGLVPQEIGFPDAVSARTCLRLVTGQRPERGLVPPVGELAERLGVAALLDRRVGGFSGGQRRRLAVLLGLAHAPDLLVLDEATTNLDERSRRETWSLVRDYAARGGAALVTSHILADIDAHADDVVALAGGRVVLASPLAGVRARLGSDTVTVRVPPEQRAAVRAAAQAVRAVAGRAESANAGSVREVLADGDQLTWRTSEPLALVAAIAAVTDAVDNLVVSPTPLSELLAELVPGEGPDRPGGPDGRDAPPLVEEVAPCAESC